MGKRLPIWGKTQIRERLVKEIMEASKASFEVRGFARWVDDDYSVYPMEPEFEAEIADMLGLDEEEKFPEELDELIKEIEAEHAAKKAVCIEKCRALIKELHG
jgi:hypothetical protein